MFVAVFLIVATKFGYAQKEKLSRIVAGYPVNYDEDSIGHYELPQVLKLSDGTEVTDAKTWREKRRPELVRLFAEHQFGKMPGRPEALSFKVFDKGTPVLRGEAIRKQVTVFFSSDSSRYKMDLLIYLPAKSKKPAPVLLNISFQPNSLIVDDPGVKQGFYWTKEGKYLPASQGRSGSKLDIQSFISQGIGVATVYYGDIDPDFKLGLPHGIRNLFLKPGQTHIGENEWGTISAWAWGLSRAMDYFETDKAIDAKRIALQGTSRLGKTVLWAAAYDERFKVVIASCSGEGGAALSRRNYGEGVEHMTDTSRYYYQFAPKRHAYAENINDSPVDAHMLVALIAPRALLLQTGDTDYWSDPKGEFLAAKAAEPVYRLFGRKGPGNSPIPVAGEQSMLYNTLGYYMHAGGHGPIPADWPLFVEYLKKHL